MATRARKKRKRKSFQSLILRKLKGINSNDNFIITTSKGNGIYSTKTLNEALSSVKEYTKDQKGLILLVYDKDDVTFREFENGKEIS